MKKYTAQASTVDKAIEMALNALQVSRDQAEIVVEEEGRKGFLGIGQKDAIVTVRTENTHEESLIDDMNLFPADETRSQKPSQADERILDQKSDSKSTDIENQVATDNNHLEQNQDDDSFSELEDATDSAESQQQDEEAIYAAKEYIEMIGQKLGAEDIEVDVYRELDNVYFDIQSEKPGIIIGRHGKVLDAIHTLSQIFLRNSAASKLNARLDAENYRGRKEESLKALAEHAAEKVISSNQAQILDAMPAKERKIVHRILSSNNQVTTHSEGEEPNRYLVIEPVQK